MNRGFIKLWRRSLDSGWLKNHNLWVFWSYCLLKASHKSFMARVGNQEIALSPGQFIFGRRIASEETHLTHREIRTCLALLSKWENLAIKTTNKYSIITIVNWHTYQSAVMRNDRLNGQVPTSKRPHTRTKEQENKIDPDEISSGIAALQNQYSSGLLNQVYQAIASTRKANRIANSIRLKILKSWQKYPVLQVEAAMRTYLEKGCAAQGKNENYLLGIIRNQSGEPERGRASDPNSMMRRSSGSPVLDEYYISQGYKVIP